MGKNLSFKARLFILLAIAALIPLTVVGLWAAFEIKDAAVDVQNRLSSLNVTAMNRSALAMATGEGTEQQQLAIAKANQYEGIFRRIESENIILAKYISSDQKAQNCSITKGLLMPFGMNMTAIEKSQILSSLCGPAALERDLVERDEMTESGYIGTSGGIYICWPDTTSGLPKDFDPRLQAWYKAAQRDGETTWVADDLAKGDSSLSIKCATPAYRGIELFAVVGRDISLSSIYTDLSSLRQRGYPFIVDREGTIIMLPKVRRGDAPWDNLLVQGGLFQAGSEMSRLAGRMTAGESGSAVITLGGRNWYVVFASIPSPGWSLGIAFPSEDTLLPASFIESGVKGTAKEATSWMEETATRVEAATILAVVIFGGIFGAVGYLLGREIDRRAGVVTALAKRIGGGDLERKIDSSPNVMGGPLKETVEAMEAMRGGLKLHIAGLQSEAANKGRREMEQEISAAIGRDTQEGRIPLIDGYQMAAKSGRSGKGDFPFYDLIELDGGRLAIVIGEVSGSGVPAAVLGVMVRTLFRALSPVFDPAEVLRQANLRLSEATHGMTVSCALFILDIEGHTAEYANAGHSPPFVIGEPGSVDTLCSGGIPLGGLDNLEPEVVLRPIGKGDLLVLYSDGLVEEASKFNLEQLITLLIENRAAQPSEIVDVVDKKSRFGGRTPTDYALIIIKRV